MKRYLFFLLLGSGCRICSAQSDYQLTVDELFTRGLENSIAIQSAVVKTQLSADKVSLARNKQLPDISVGGAFGFVGTPTILDTDLSFLKHSDTPDWKQNYQITVTQPLYQGGKIRNNISRSQLEEEIAKLSLQKDKAELKYWLIGKYLDLFNLYKKRDLYTQNIEEAKIRLRDIEKMKEQGMITTNDVLRSKLTLTNYQLAYDESINDIALVSQQLDIVLGLDEALILEPDDNLLSAAMDLKDEAYYVEEAYALYPDLQIANSNIELARNNLEITKSDYLPNLSLQVSNALVRPIPYVVPTQDLFVNSWGVTLNLSYRISAWFDKKHSMGSAKRQIQLQELAKDQQMQTIRTAVKTAYLKHSEALNRIKVLEESVTQADENYRVMKNKYFNQLSILTDMLDANSVQLNAQLQLTTAKVNAVYTYYQLQKISGNL